MKIIWLVLAVCWFCLLFCSMSVAQRPTPPTSFSVIIYTYIGDIELTRSRMNYDLEKKAERVETVQHNHLDISILRYDQNKVYAWVDGTQECHVTNIPEGTDPNIWNWLQNAQDKGPYSYFGQRCELWFAEEQLGTTLGCFTSDSTPLFLNVTMEELPLNHLLFVNFRPGPQPASLFQPPSFCSTLD